MSSDKFHELYVWVAGAALVCVALQLGAGFGKWLSTPASASVPEQPTCEVGSE